MHRSILKIAAVLGFSIALLGCGDDDPSPGVDAAPDGEAPDAGDTMVDGAINEKPLCTAPTEFAFESKFVEVLGSQMHYIEEGEGPVVLMLHGNPTSSYLWRNIIGPVAEDYRVLAPDLIGMGRSDKPDLDYTFDTHSQYLRGFIETLGLSDITLVIHDWGSGLGFDYAANNEGNVRGIAFMEAIVEPGAPGSFSDLDPQTAQAFMAWRDPALAPQLLQEENQFLSVFLPQATSCVLPEEAVSAYLEPFPTPESRLPVRVWPSQIPIDGEPAEMVTRVEAYNTWLRGSTIPKLGLSADPGFILPPMAFDFLQASWTNLTVVDIGPGLHFVQERQPEAIANALLQWLSEIGPSENPVRRTHVESLSYATVEGQTMAYLEAGDPADPPVIMLHGIPTSSMVFRDVVPPVAAAGYRVIAPDLLGFGESDKPDAPTYSLADHARRIFALADELGMTDFVLLVHDIGGFVGWEMLAQNADRLRGLVITDTTFSLQGVTPNELALMHFGPGATRTAREVWSELDRPEFANIAARSFLVQGFFDDALATEELIDAYAEPLSSGTSEAFIQFFDGLNVELAPDAVAARRVRFQGFGKPAAIIFGADDEFFDATVIPPMFASDFSVPADRTTIVPSAGHYLQEENPSAYSAAVVAFLEDL